MTGQQCVGGGRWRQVGGAVVATPGLIGRGITTRSCGWRGWTEGDGCPQCGGQLARVDLGGRARAELHLTG